MTTLAIHPTSNKAQPSKQNSRPRRRERSLWRHDRPLELVFHPLAWLKLQFFCHAGQTEVGGFAVSAEHDPLYVEQFVTIKQFASAAFVRFDPVAVADHFDACVDAGLPPARCVRVWLHTHPGSSADPSHVDEETFETAFGGCDWSVIVHPQPHRADLCPAELSRTTRGQAAELANLLQVWAAEFAQNIQPEPPRGNGVSALQMLSDEPTGWGLSAELDNLAELQASGDVTRDQLDEALLELQDRYVVGADTVRAFEDEEVLQ